MSHSVYVNIPIEQDLVLKGIIQLNTNKSGGPDIFCFYEFFIHGKTTLPIYLLNLFNKLFNIGYFSLVGLVFCCSST